MQTAYWIVLLTLSAAAALWRPPHIARATFAILGCGIASLILAPLPFIGWPSDNYSIAMMIVDVIAAFIVLKPPPSLWSAIIGATYLTQIGFHATRIISHPSDMSSFYMGLSFMAVLQLAVIGGWWFDEAIVRHRFVHRKREVAASAHRKSDAP